MEATKDELRVLVGVRCETLAADLKESLDAHIRPATIDRLIELLQALKEDASGTTP